MAYVTVVGGESILDDPGARRIFNSSAGSMCSLGRALRKTNPLTLSCGGLCAGNCFPASCGKTAAGCRDTSVQDGSLASGCSLRERQLVVTSTPGFSLGASALTSGRVLQEQVLRAPLCCP